MSSSNTSYLSTLIKPGDPAVRVMASYHTNVKRHDHDFYELVYVTEGFCLHDADSSITLLMEGDVFILKPGVSHRYIGNRVTRIYNCVFKPEAVAGQLAALKALPGLDRLFSPDLMLATPRLHLSLSERKTFLKLITGMCEECGDQPVGWSIRVCSMLACLLVEYSRAYLAHVGSNTENAAYSAYVSQALTYIDQSYADPSLTVQSIALSVGVTSDYLSRQFRQVTGIAVQEYLRRYRFARSMELLQSDLPVSEVARSVGFGSLCHFSREFKKELGLTPSQYRAQSQG